MQQSWMDRILAAFGHMKSMERLHVDTFTEEKINEVTGVPLGFADRNLLYARTNELVGYHYLETVVIGDFHVKTVKGATLTLIGDDFEVVLRSEMDEVQSDYSNVSNRSMTTIDFEIDEADLDKLKVSRLKGLSLTAKKRKVEFKISQD